MTNVIAPSKPLTCSVGLDILLGMACSIILYAARVKEMMARYGKDSCA